MSRCFSSDDIKARLAYLRSHPFPGRDEPKPSATPCPPDPSSSVALAKEDPDPANEDAMSVADSLNGPVPSTPASCPQSETENSLTFSADEVRRCESELARELYSTARYRLLALRAGNAPKAAFSEIARFIDLASTLARRAAGLADQTSAASAANNRAFIQFEEAIKEIAAQSAAASTANVGASNSSEPLEAFGSAAVNTTGDRPG